jgi:sarcosine oxidase subunit gamma
MAEAITMVAPLSNLPGPFVLRGMRCAPVAPMARFVFRGGADALREAGDAVGMDFPSALCASTMGERVILWQGPDEFLFLVPNEEKQTLSAAIGEALAGVPHSLVDVSHRNVALLMEGDQVELLLAAGIMLDLSLTSFPVGMTTRTLFGKADVTLWRQAPDRFHLETWRSFAPYVVGLLEESARGL